MDQQRPHTLHDRIEAWEHRADCDLELNKNVNDAMGLGITAEELKKMVWEGLKESIKAGYREAHEAEETYFNWFNTKPEGTE